MNRDRKYRQTDWIDPRISVRSSPTQGSGMFATAPIEQGQVVTIWGGTRLLTEEDIAGTRSEDWRAKGYVWATIGEGVYLAGLLDGDEDLSNLINHSCDPNVWMQDEVTLAVRRDIAEGEELTIDYAMFEASDDWAPGWECHCGSELCRGRFTGMDWRRQDLQKRYQGHFSPFINERIEHLAAIHSGCRPITGRRGK